MNAGATRATMQSAVSPVGSWRAIRLNADEVELLAHAAWRGEGFLPERRTACRREVDVKRQLFFGVPFE